MPSPSTMACRALTFSRRRLEIGSLVSLPLLPALALLLTGLLTATPSAACVGAPPEPFCTKTLQLAIAGPPVVLLPGGGTFDVSALLYFGVLDFPAGTGICPGGPYTASVTITATCTPGGADGSGELLGAAISTGYNELTVPVTVPAGPARSCVLEAEATVVLGDGMVLTDRADNVACLGDPAPGEPSEPRLDLHLVGPPGSEVGRVSPGDPVGFVYRLVNNDPDVSFSGTLSADSRNESRQPGASGPMPPGTAVVSISDPVAGDNFPIELLAGGPNAPEGDPVAEGCIALPRDPADPGVPADSLDIHLEPGEATLVTLFSRPWGMCADGSCGRATLQLEGSFSDASPGLACSGVVTAADTSRGPGSACDDSGEVVQILPPADPLGLTIAGSPELGIDLEIALRLLEILLAENGAPAQAALPFSGTLTPERGRIQVQFAESFAIDSFFDVSFRLEIAVDGDPTAVASTSGGTSGAPRGFESTAPFVAPTVRIESLEGAGLLGHFAPVVQVSAIGIDNVGERRLLSFQGIELSPLPDGTGIGGQLTGGEVEPGAGDSLDAIELAFDLRGFVSPEPQSFLIFEDGFESGNISRWSNGQP